MKDPRTDKERTSLGPDLIPLLFGAADVDQLPGVVLTRMLTDLGVATSAARSIIARSVKRGALTSTHRGRETAYGLGAGTLTAFQRLRDRQRPPHSWSGHFHAVLYSIPETERAYRDALRQHARQTGYGTLRPGLLIHLDDHWASLQKLVGTPPTSAAVYSAALGLDLDSARRAAAEAWDLATMARIYRQHHRDLDAATRAGTGSEGNPAMLRQYVAAVRPVFASLYDDPNLPAELLSAGWPRPTTVTALEQVVRTFHRPMQRYLTELNGSG